VTGSIDSAARAIFGCPPAETDGMVTSTLNEPSALVFVVASTSFTFAAVRTPTFTGSTAVGFAEFPWAAHPEKFLPDTVILLPGMALVALTENTGTLQDAEGFGTAGAADAEIVPSMVTATAAPITAIERTTKLDLPTKPSKECGKPMRPIGFSERTGTLSATRTSRP